MKAILLALTLFAWPVTTQTLTKPERDRAVAELDQSRQALRDATKGLSEAQWNFKAAPDRWSARQCVEHITLAEDLVYQIVTVQIQKEPAAPEKRGEVDGKDSFVLKTVTDRSHKFNAPEPLIPSGHFGSIMDTFKHFEQSRDRTIDYVKGTQDDLRDHYADHPALKTLDGYQWILLVAAHTRRHTAQLLEIKADPGFPKE